MCGKIPGGVYISPQSPGFGNVWKCFCVSIPFNTARQSELKALNGKFIKVITLWKNEKQISIFHKMKSDDVFIFAK